MGRIEHQNSYVFCHFGKKHGMCGEPCESEIIYVKRNNKRQIGKADCGVVIKSLGNLMTERLTFVGQVVSQKALNRKMNFGKNKLEGSSRDTNKGETGRRALAVI